MAAKNLSKASLRLTGRIFNADRRGGFSNDRGAYSRFFMEREKQIRENLTPLTSKIIKMTPEEKLEYNKQKAPEITRKEKNKPIRYKRNKKKGQYIGRATDKPFGESNFYDWKVWQMLTPKAKHKVLLHNQRGDTPEMYMEFHDKMKRKQQSRDLPKVGKSIHTSNKSKKYKPAYPESGSNSEPHKSAYGAGLTKKNPETLERKSTINSLPKEKKLTPKRRKKNA